MTPVQTLPVHALRDVLETPGPCITAVLQPPAAHSAANAEKLLNNLKHELKERGLDPEPLLAPMLEYVAGNPRPGTVALFRSPARFFTADLPDHFPPLTRIADRFHVRCLLAAQDYERAFFILALSQNRTRILRCTRTSSEELPWPPGYPDNLADQKHTRQPDHVLDNRRTAGPSTGSMKGVMFGTSSDMDDKEEFMIHYFMTIDSAVRAALRSLPEEEQNLPLIPVGVEHELATYRRVNT